MLVVTATEHALTEEIDQETILVCRGVGVHFLTDDVAPNVLTEIITLALERQGSSIALGVILVLDTLCSHTLVIHGQHTPLTSPAVRLAVDLDTLPRDLFRYKVT